MITVLSSCVLYCAGLLAPNPHIAIGVNHMGWRPDSPKWCRVDNPPSEHFVLQTRGTNLTWNIVYRGRWTPSANSNGVFFADITEAAAKPKQASLFRCLLSPSKYRR